MHLLMLDWLVLSPSLYQRYHRMKTILLPQLAQKADKSSKGSVPTSVVARAMLRSSLKEGEGGLLEHKDIVNLGKE